MSITTLGVQYPLATRQRPDVRKKYRAENAERKEEKEERMKKNYSAAAGPATPRGRFVNHTRLMSRMHRMADIQK